MGSIHHVYNRGNNKERIFYDEQDYRAFLYRLGLAIGIEPEILNNEEFTRAPKSRVRILKPYKGQFKIHAFCIMPNHYHILIEQLSDTLIYKLIHKVCTSFSMYMNKKYKRVGHIFQDRFKSVLMESDRQLMWNVSYIHMNPVKSGLVTNPYDYKWSSYNDYVSNRKLPLTYTEFSISVFGGKENFTRNNFVLSQDVSRHVLDS